MKNMWLVLAIGIILVSIVVILFTFLGGENENLEWEAVVFDAFTLDLIGNAEVHELTFDNDNAYISLTVGDQDFTLDAEKIEISANNPQVRSYYAEFTSNDLKYRAQISEYGEYISLMLGEMDAFPTAGTRFSIVIGKSGQLDDVDNSVQELKMHLEE